MGKHLNSIKFDDFVSTIYLPHAKIRKRSWQVDERIARKHLSPVFGSNFMDQIKTADISRWLTSLAEHHYAPATCNRIFAVLRAIFNMAIRHGYLADPVSPCTGIPVFHIQKQRAISLNADTARMIMEELKKYTHPHAKALRLLLLTGARKSEILRARWEFVNLSRQTLLVPISKSGKPREIYLSEEAIRIIASLESSGHSPWLFPARGGEKPVSDIYAFWNMIRLKLDLAKLRIHDLRHTFASILVNSGHTLYEVQNLLGHSEPRTTMRYAHLAPAPLLRAAHTVGRLLDTVEVKPGTEISLTYSHLLRWLASIPWGLIASVLEKAGVGGTKTSSDHMSMRH